jgi:hypothetical protein
VGSIRHADNLSSTRSETPDNLLCMPQGPIIIFDKSSLESLNLNEAVLLDNFYMSNITPLFFVECLADCAEESIIKSLYRNRRNCMIVITAPTGQSDAKFSPMSSTALSRFG